MDVARAVYMALGHGPCCIGHGLLAAAGWSLRNSPVNERRVDDIVVNLVQRIEFGEKCGDDGRSRRVRQLPSPKLARDIRVSRLRVQEAGYTDGAGGEGLRGAK